MQRFISLLFVFLVGCQRPAATVLTYATAPVPAVTDGATSTGKITSGESGRARRLAIVVNGRVLSATYIRSAIRDRAEITGDFTSEEVQELANVLNASTLPVRFTRVSIRHVGDQ